MSNKEFILVVITGLIFLLIGIVCMVFPQRIQQLAIRIYSGGKGLAKFNPFIEWIKTPKYIFSLRIIGIISLIIFGLMVYLIFFKYI
jgi:uncharacterized protein YjeT (DUF2065 family)